MNYLYAYTPQQEPVDPDNPNPVPQDNSAYVGELANGDYVHLLPNEDPEAVLVGHWDNDGSLHIVDHAVYAELRPLGNVDGVASDALGLSHYQGHDQRHLQENPVEGTLPQYPATEQPFSLRITRTKTTDDAWSHIPWGWTVEMLSDDPQRDITARAIGIYDENDNYLYTTGAFVLMDFEETDENGDPVTVQRYGTVCPVGQRTATAAPVHFKLLLGSAPEGAWVLEDLDEGAEQTRLFWEHDQSPSAGGWVTINAVTNGMAGTVVLTSPNNSELSVGSQVRIDGVESTVTSLWTTGGVVLDPYQAYASGLPIEVYT